MCHMHIIHFPKQKDTKEEGKLNHAFIFVDSADITLNEKLIYRTDI